MMTQYPYGIGGRHLAGNDPLSDQIATTLNNMLQGGEPGSTEYNQRTEFFSDVLSKTGQKFVDSDKGKQAINRAVYGVMVPLSLVAFVAGYLMGKKRG